MKYIPLTVAFGFGCAAGVIASLLAGDRHFDRAIGQAKEAIELAGYWRGEAKQWKSVTDRCIVSLQDLAAQAANK